MGVVGAILLYIYLKTYIFAYTSSCLNKQIIDKYKYKNNYTNIYKLWKTCTPPIFKHNSCESSTAGSTMDHRFAALS